MSIEKYINNSIMILMCGIFTAVLSGVFIVFEKWTYLGLIFAPVLIYLSNKNLFVFPFGLYVLLLPFEPLLAEQNSLIASKLIKLLGMLTIIVMLFKGTFEKKLRRPDNVTLLWVLLISYGLLTALWASDPKLVLSVYTFQTLIGLFLFYYVVSAYYINEKDFHIIKMCVFWGGLLAAIYSLSMAESLQDSRVAIEGGGANFFAFSLLFPIAISIEYGLSAKNKIMKSLFLAAFGILLFCIIASGSRGGFLGFMAIIIIYLIYSRQRLLFGVSIIALGIVFMSYIPDFFFERWGEASEEGGSGRLYIWYIALNALEKYWSVGIGLNNFPLAFNEFAHHYTAIDKTNYAAHNLYIGLFVELGIIGFMLLIIVLVKHYTMIRSQSNHNLEAVMLKASFAGLLISSFFLDTFKSKTLWLLWTMILMNSKYRSIEIK